MDNSDLYHGHRALQRVDRVSRPCPLEDSHGKDSQHNGAWTGAEAE